MNRADQRKYHVIYKTTCAVTGKYYVGMHSTDDLNDGYLGSGKILWHSIRAHGKENHRYEILEYLPDRKSLCDREAQLISEELRADPLCMNIRGGGIGNTPGIPLAEETKAKMSSSLKKMWAELHASGYVHPKQSDQTKQKRAESNRGKKRTEETRWRMREAQRIFHDGKSDEQKLRESANMSKAKSKVWRLDSPNGELLISNIKRFAIDNHLSASKLYKTRVTGKYCGDFRIIGLA